MKKTLIIFSLSIILFSLKLHAGDYFPTILIETWWGEQDGEFGLMIEAEGNCPQSLAIDEEGNLAILDAVNKRIQIYSSDGKWIGKFAISSNAFDIEYENKAFCLLAPYDYSIEKYNQDGKLIEKISINRKIEFLDGLRISDQKVFVRTVEQLQYRADEKSQQSQLQSVQNGLTGHISDIRFQTRWNDPHKGYLIIDDQKSAKRQTISISTQDELGSIVFLDTDKKGNIYIRKELFSQNGKSYFEIDKFDTEGVLLSSLQIENDNLVAPFKPITIDREGTIYFLDIQPERFAVIRWQEQK